MAAPNLTVWCVKVGTAYSDDDVRLLKAQVARHTRNTFDFWCLTDKPIQGIDCIIPAEIWPGWWCKLALFRYARTGLNVYLDLDTVVLGNVESLASETFSAPANWGQSGHGGIQSSAMAWGLDYGWIADAFDPALLTADPSHPFGRYGDTDYWGDQGFLSALLGDPGNANVEPMRGIYSYKYHCHNGPPANAVAVTFHGRPKPDEVNDAWVLAARLST